MIDAQVIPVIEEGRLSHFLVNEKPARHSHDATASAASACPPVADGSAIHSPALSMAGRTAEASLSSTAGLRGASHRPVHDRSCERKGQHDHV